jgi:hypothetical protein
MTMTENPFTEFFLDPGFHRINKATYLADPCRRPSLSSSIASLLLSRSPAHAFAAHPRLGGHRSDPTAAMINGTLIDSLLCGGDADIIESPYDEYRTNEAKAWRDAQESQGKMPVKRKEMERAKKAAAYIEENMLAQGIELKGEHQPSLIWEADGVLCRGRLDHWIADTATIIDLKTSENGSPLGLASKFGAFGYDVQWAAYTQAVETLRPDLAGRVNFVFVFVETEPPYSVTLARPAGTMRAYGKSRWDRAVRLWGECLAANKWPAYAPTEVEASPWMMAEMEAAIPEGGSPGAPF